jgi:hypothetical protein
VQPQRAGAQQGLRKAEAEETQLKACGAATASVLVLEFSPDSKIAAAMRSLRSSGSPGRVVIWSCPRSRHMLPRLSRIGPQDTNTIHYTIQIRIIHNTRPFPVCYGSLAQAGLRAPGFRCRCLGLLASGSEAFGRREKEREDEHIHMSRYAEMSRRAVRSADTQYMCILHNIDFYSFYIYF